MKYSAIYSIYVSSRVNTSIKEILKQTENPNKNEYNNNLNEHRFLVGIRR